MATVTTIVQLCIIPIFGFLAKALVSFFGKEKEATINNMKKKASDYAIKVLSEVITDCVAATNQTYVDALKEKDKFDLDAQEKALSITKEAIINILNEEIKETLNETFGDLNTYITQKIESTIRLGQK